MIFSEERLGGGGGAKGWANVWGMAFFLTLGCELIILVGNNLCKKSTQDLDSRKHLL